MFYMAASYFVTGIQMLVDFFSLKAQCLILEGFNIHCALENTTISCYAEIEFYSIKNISRKQWDSEKTEEKKTEREKIPCRIYGTRKKFPFFLRDGTEFLSRLWN